jgi:hypothetical protein
MAWLPEPGGSAEIEEDAGMLFVGLFAAVGLRILEAQAGGRYLSERVRDPDQRNNQRSLKQPVIF